LRQKYGDDFREKNPQEVEDELFTFYAERLRASGQFDFACPAVVLHPDVERTYFHLIYATRHPKGVEVFKGVEKKAFEFQEQVRAEAEQRKETQKTGKQSLFKDLPQPPSHRAVTLRERYLAAVQKRIEELGAKTKQVRYDDIWGAAMAFPLVWDSDVKELITSWQKSGRVKVLNLPPRHKPKWGQNHIVEFLK
jgi:hypothetical protein